MADNNVVYMVGWCPDCGRTVVVRHEEDAPGIVMLEKVVRE